MQKVQSRRQELLEPIFGKAQQAIQDVGKENGFNLIFDTSAVLNAILFTRDSEDVMELVRKKLGL